MNSYEYLLERISENISNNEDREYIKNNVSEIAKSLKNFSLLFNQLVAISVDNISYNEKIEKISNISFDSNNVFSIEEAKQIMDALYLENLDSFDKNNSGILTGGEISDKSLDKTEINKQNIENIKEINTNIDKNVKFCFSNIGLMAIKLVTEFPKYGLLVISNFFSGLSNLYNSDLNTFRDFTKKLDWVFILLFILASIPFIGFYMDVIIIIRALRQERYFLAILTLITTIVSMFTLHAVDLGAIIKFLYYLDIYSYTNLNNTSQIPIDSNRELFLRNREKQGLYIQDGNLIPVNKLKMAIDTVKDNVVDSETITKNDKNENLDNLKENVVVSNQNSKNSDKSMVEYNRKKNDSDLFMVETVQSIDKNNIESDYSDDDSKSLEDFKRTKQNVLKDSDISSNHSDSDVSSLSKFNRK
tara:strand:- start:1230 stop:2480 length:1251 start_codon:yes stop_codon:yes gene_type:complete